MALDARCASAALTSRTCSITPTVSFFATAARSARAASRAGPASASVTARTMSLTSYPAFEPFWRLPGVLLNGAESGPIASRASMSRVDRTTACE